jgi:hypothetical protein
MDDRFVELCFGGKFILRFNKNEDGSYGRFEKDEVLALQPMIDAAFGPTDEDYLAALGPCGK